jgi:hypothetical protein
MEWLVGAWNSVLGVVADRIYFHREKGGFSFCGPREGDGGTAAWGVAGKDGTAAVPPELYSCDRRSRLS